MKRPLPFHDKKFIEKSTFDPLMYNQGTFDVFQKAVRHEITQQPIKTPRYKNTNKQELQALKQLANNPNIVIRKADKGSCVVVQDTKQYLEECFKQLSDKRFYMRENRNLTSDHNKNQIPEQLLFTLSQKFTKMSGRPILSANDSPTERISTFVDYFLQTCVPLMRSFVKDSTHFVKKCSL